MLENELITYEQFKTGLFFKYGMIYTQSKPFIKFNQTFNYGPALFERMIDLKVTAENILDSLKNNKHNRRKIKVFNLMAQGYMQWEIAKKLNISTRTIKRYVIEMKNYLKTDLSLFTRANTQVINKGNKEKIEEIKETFMVGVGYIEI